MGYLETARHEERREERGEGGRRLFYTGPYGTQLITNTSLFQEFFCRSMISPGELGLLGTGDRSRHRGKGSSGMIWESVLDDSCWHH